MDTTKVATKKDIKDLKAELKSEFRLEFKSVRGEILKVEERTENVEDGIKELKADNQQLNAKLDKLQNTMDKFVGRVDDLSVDNEVGTHHTRELELKVDDHEKRLKIIESSSKATA